ncbi:hypothetical protein HNQ56_004840 [Anaerotaenia torta]
MRSKKPTFIMRRVSKRGNREFVAKQVPNTDINMAAFIERSIPVKMIAKKAAFLTFPRSFTEG